MPASQRDRSRLELADSLISGGLVTDISAPGRTESDATSAIVVKIRAGRHKMPLDIREIWTYRELLYLLAWRDVKVRYKQTIFGVAWAILQPLLSALIFAIFFGRLVKVPSDGLPYLIFAYTGMLVWTFFANALSQGGESLVNSAHIITKVYFPRVIVPCAVVLAALVDLAIAFMILVVMMVWYRVMPGAGALMSIPLTLTVMVLAVGVALFVSALNVKYRDVRYAIPFLIQIWMVATPIIYPASLVPAPWRALLWLNPMSGLVEGCRATLFSRRVQWYAITYSVAVALLLVYVGSLFFRRIEREFADVI